MVPQRLIVIGFTLLLGSWIVLLLTVINLIPRSLLLSLIAYGTSVVGLVIGLLGTVHYVRDARGDTRHRRS
jgi:membrane associated rhomboid family serine protease